MGYVLYANDKPIGTSDSLDQAKANATGYVQPGRPLRIESFVAPAPSRTWTYDYGIDDWIETI